MKKINTLSKLALIIVAMCTSGIANAQSPIVPLSNMTDDFSITFNAGENQSVTAVDDATFPAGIGVNTTKVFKNVTQDIQWDAWWWCGVINFNTEVQITTTTKTLKFKFYGVDASKYRIIIKNAAGQDILELQDVPINPNKWTTYEIDLSKFIGNNIKSILLAPGKRNQVVYVYPYFEDATAVPSLASKSELIPNMTTADFDFGDNHPGTAASVIDITGLNVPDTFVSKVFKITSENNPAREWWWSAVVGLKTPQLIPANDKTVLMAKVLSTSDRILLKLESTVSTINTSYNLGYRTVVPNQWTDIVLDFITPDRGSASLKWIYFSPIVNTDLYVYFYWATVTDVSTAVDKLEQNQKNIKLIGNNIIVEGASTIKQYGMSGKLITTKNGNSVTAIKGMNIIVADGVAYKVIYNGL